MNDVFTNPKSTASDPLILKTFEDYAQAFETLDPSVVLPFYQYPAILISEQKPVKIPNKIMGWAAFKIAMMGLNRRGYHHGKTESLQVRQLRADLAIITGTVIRYKKDSSELERFDLNYTLRKVNHRWKIIVGTLLVISDESPKPN
jgi:ketosteroid isomerase-like protein